MLLTAITAMLIAAALVRPPRPRSNPAIARWFQIATYRHGSVAHLTPVRDGQHTEDENGECGCNPRPGPYPLNNGRTGTLYIHRMISGDNNRKAR